MRLCAQAVGGSLEPRSRLVESTAHGGSLAQGMEIVAVGVANKSIATARLLLVKSELRKAGILVVGAGCTSSAPRAGGAARLRRDVRVAG
jgi:hypothetical protein